MGNDAIQTYHQFIPRGNGPTAWFGWFILRCFNVPVCRRWGCWRHRNQSGGRFVCERIGGSEWVRFYLEMRVRRFRVMYETLLKTQWAGVCIEQKQLKPKSQRALNTSLCVRFYCLSTENPNRATCNLFRFVRRRNDGGHCRLIVWRW